MEGRICSKRTRTSGSRRPKSILDFRDRLQVKVHNDELVTFLSDSKHVLGAMQLQPPDNILESLFYQQVHGSQSIRDQVAYYDRLDTDHPDRSYKFLVSAVRTHI